MKACLFDFDGVIVDSERHWRELGDGVFFPSLVKNWTERDGARMMGMGEQAGYELLTREYGLTIGYDEYKTRKSVLITDIYMQKLNLLPGIPELIKRLESLNIKLAIGSSSTDDWINATLMRFDLLKHFPVIVSSTAVGERTKPHPDIYLLAAKGVGVDPHDCVVLEDSSNGVRAAKAADMTCIAIRTDMNPEQDLSMADRVITHFDELTTEELKAL